MVGWAILMGFCLPVKKMSFCPNLGPSASCFSFSFRYTCMCMTRYICICVYVLTPRARYALGGGSPPRAFLNIDWKGKKANQLEPHVFFCLYEYL